MSKSSSPSDYDFLNSGGSSLYSPDYNTGQGYYTSVEMVSDLLQIPSFTGSSLFKVCLASDTHLGTFRNKTEAIL